MLFPIRILSDYRPRIGNGAVQLKLYNRFAFHFREGAKAVTGGGGIGSEGSGWGGKCGRLVCIAGAAILDT